MKSILIYGQRVLARKQGRASGIDVFHGAVAAMRDGYQLAAYERIVTPAGVTVIRKRH